MGAVLFFLSQWNQVALYEIENIAYVLQSNLFAWNKKITVIQPTQICEKKSKIEIDFYLTGYGVDPEKSFSEFHYSPPPCSTHICSVIQKHKYNKNLISVIIPYQYEVNLWKRNPNYQGLINEIKNQINCQNGLDIIPNSIALHSRSGQVLAYWNQIDLNFKEVFLTDPHIDMTTLKRHYPGEKRSKEEIFLDFILKSIQKKTKIHWITSRNKAFIQDQKNALIFLENNSYTTKTQSDDFDFVSEITKNSHLGLQYVCNPKTNKRCFIHSSIRWKYETN